MRTCGTHLIIGLLLITGMATSASARGLVHPNLTNHSSQLPMTILVEVESTPGSRQHLSAAMSAPIRTDRMKAVPSAAQQAAAGRDSRFVPTLQQFATDSVRSFWVAPFYALTINPTDLDLIANLDGVVAIYPNVPLEAVAPVRVEPSGSAAGIATELTALNVPAVWSQGFTGRGRLVCSFDTGVDGDHPALTNRWRGNSASTDASWFSPLASATLPTDRTGHGTHTMGIMVGRDGDDRFGVAPDAEWISAGVIDQGRSLGVTIADILDAFQWALNPDGDLTTTDDVPDVILNSWGIPAGIFADCDNSFWGAIDLVEAAGIVTIFAAGNEGPLPRTVRDPADRASSPLNAFSVGAVDAESSIASFSSRGPSRCNPEAVKPEVVAPGVSIRSATKDGGYALMSGTSMAAPYIAGLVALAREAYPNASVRRIKEALIASAQDLGVLGEDNAYGWGMVDAALFLELLDDPAPVSFSLREVAWENGAIGAPGSEIGLEITLGQSGAHLSAVAARLTSLDAEAAEVQGDSTSFLFGPIGSIAQTSQPFVITLADTLTHGRSLGFALKLYRSTGELIDSLTFELAAGYPAPGLLGAHESGGLALSVSDFGQFGLAAGSLYPVGGEGLRFGGSDNLLYEGAIFVGRSPLQLATATRGDDGRFAPSDFVATEALATGTGGSYRATMKDQAAPIPIPITIRQETEADSDGRFIILKYTIVNTSLEIISNLAMGCLFDLDMPGGDIVDYDAVEGMLTIRGGTGPIIGLTALENGRLFHRLANGSEKLGLSRGDLYSLLSDSVSRDDAASDDAMVSLTSQPVTLHPGDSATVSYVVLGADDFATVYDNLIAARERYLSPTDVDDDNPLGLPDDFTLHANYPNPFNPTTTISWSLQSRARVELTVVNLLGQTVATLADGEYPAGTHSLRWDSRDQSGRRLASGVYFARLTTPSGSAVRKMMLLK